MSRPKSGWSQLYEEVGGVLSPSISTLHSHEALFTFVPSQLRFVVDEGEQWVEWQWQEEPHVRPKVQVKEGDEVRDCLSQFCKIAGGHPSKIEQFIRIWGPLGSKPRIRHEGGVLVYREPLKVYEEDAKYLSAILSILTCLITERKTKEEDWKVMFPKGVMLRVGRLGPDPIIKTTLEMTEVHEDIQWHYLCSVCTMALQNSDMRLEVRCNYTDKRRFICLAPPSPIATEFDEVNCEMDEEEEDDFPYQHSTPENYVSMYSDWWDYREVANPYRPSPLRAILAIQLSLLVMDPSVTTCGVCGNPCKRVRRTQQSYCSDECKRVKQIEWSTENRKKRTLEKDSLPEATPEAG